MKRLLLLLLMTLLCRDMQGTAYSFNILGHEFTDTNTIDIDKTFDAVLQINPMVNDLKDGPQIVPVLRKQENKSLVFFIALLLLYVFAAVRLMFSHQFSGSLAFLTTLNEKRKQPTETDQISSLSFYALYLITVGYLAYTFLQTYHVHFAHFPPLGAILVCITVVTILYVIKQTLMYLLAWTFDKKALLTQYFLNVAIVYKMTAIVLFPLSIMILVSASSLASLLLKLAVLIVILSVLFRYIRNFGLVKKLLTVHFLHFFVYLCAFEIMPLLLLYRLIR